MARVYLSRSENRFRAARGRSKIDHLSPRSGGLHVASPLFLRRRFLRGASRPGQADARGVEEARGGGEARLVYDGRGGAGEGGAGGGGGGLRGGGEAAGAAHGH